MIAIRSRKTGHTFITMWAGKLRLALVAVFAYKISFAQAKKVIGGCVATDAAIRAIYIAAWIQYLARRADEILSAVAVEICGRFHDALAIVMARFRQAHIVKLTVSARIIRRAFAFVRVGHIYALRTV